MVSGYIYPYVPGCEDETISWDHLLYDCNPASTTERFQQHFDPWLHTCTLKGTSGCSRPNYEPIALVLSVFVDFISEYNRAIWIWVPAYATELQVLLSESMVTSNDGAFSLAAPSLILNSSSMTSVSDITFTFDSSVTGASLLSTIGSGSVNVTSTNGSVHFAHGNASGSTAATMNLTAAMNIYAAQNVEIAQISTSVSSKLTLVCSHSWFSSRNLVCSAAQICPLWICSISAYLPVVLEYVTAVHDAGGRRLKRIWFHLWTISLFHRLRCLRK